MLTSILSRINLTHWSSDTHQRGSIWVIFLSGRAASVLRVSACQRYLNDHLWAEHLIPVFPNKGRLLLAEDSIFWWLKAQITGFIVRPQRGVSEDLSGLGWGLVMFKFLN